MSRPLDPTTRRRVVPTILLASVVSAGSLGLAGCGSGGSRPSAARSNGLATALPTKVWQAAARAMGSAKSVHLAGSVSSTESLALTLFGTGDSVGTITTGGQTVRFVASHNVYFLKGSLAFWEKSESLPSSVSKGIAGKWVRLPASAASAFGQMSYDSVLSQIQRVPAGLKRLGSLLLAGTRVVGIQSTRSSTLYVLAAGTPYPFEIAQSPGSRSYLRFSAWNQGSTPSAPAGSVPFPGPTG